jgi:hypothetical protein
MPRPQAFARELKVATAGLEPQAIATLLAKSARAILAESQAARQFPQNYVKSVNGKIGAREESVVPPGPIVYTAVWWSEIVTYGLAFAEERSPVRSGRFKSSWFAMSNGTQVLDYESIPITAEVIITNDQPYSRKIEVGHQRVNVPPGVVLDLVSALRRKFGELVIVQRRFINLQGAYRLKTEGSRRSQIRRRSRRGVVGRVLTYPAAVITLRF